MRQISNAIESPPFVVVGRICQTVSTDPFHVIVNSVDHERFQRLLHFQWGKYKA
jgi:hypothetical protein